MHGVQFIINLQKGIIVNLKTCELQNYYELHITWLAYDVTQFEGP